MSWCLQVLDYPDRCDCAREADVGEARGGYLKKAAEAQNAYAMVDMMERTRIDGG